MFPIPQTRVVLLLVAFLAISDVADAQTGWHEGFEGQEPSWHEAGGDAQYRILQHQRIPTIAHGGKGCEWIEIEGNGGTQVYFSQEIGRPRIIEDLVPSVWIKSDRPGLILALRLILPRTIDSRSGQPLVTILQGPAYTEVGRWQQLRLAGLPTLLTRQVHLLRAQLGPQIEEREAYLDAVLLNVYGGPGVTNVWIDDLDVVGHVAMANEPTPAEGPALEAPSNAGWTPKESQTSVSAAGPLVPVRLPPVQDKNGIVAQPPSAVASDSAQPRAAVLPSTPPRRMVKLAGSVLSVNGRPLFPRIIQHCGEPLSLLKKLGFNTVWLQRLPATEMLEEADRLGLWLICPPPRELTPIAEISPVFDSVLTWDLGNNLAEAELEPTQRWSEQVRAADRRGHRPLICNARVNLRGYSRAADFLLIDRRPLGTSLQMTDYAEWVRQQPLLARLGTPVWTTVQTQPNEALRRQLIALEPGSAPPLSVPSEQIRLLAYTAVAAGSRGLLFLSDSPLDAPDADTRQRAMALELLNLDLQLMEPWAAAGSFVASAESSVPEVAGAVLRTDRARLLLPIWSAAMSQCVPPQSAANSVTLVAPGIPEACNAFELTPSGVQPLRYKRVAGGLCVTLDEFGLTTQVLLAHDPLIVGEVNRRTAEVGRRAAELQRHLAAHQLNVVQTLGGRLALRTPVADSARWLDAARKAMQACDGQLASGDASGAARNAQRAMRSLRLVERAFWDIAQKGLVSPVTSPAAVSFDTLPFHWRLVDRLAAHRFGPNQIAGGDFEDINTMMRAGWQYIQHIQHSSASVQGAVDLAPDAARSGRLGLRLAAVAIDSKKPPAVVETPPVLFTSPPVQVEAGQIVCVSGWVRVSETISGSNDGLLIVDSFGGESLADRIDKTDGWRQFALYRAAPQSGMFTVTFALSGMGEACLDDVFIQVLEGSAGISSR